MAYYERDYFQEPTPHQRASFSAPRLQPVSKALLIAIVAINLVVWGFEGWSEQALTNVDLSVAYKWLVLGPSALYPSGEGAIFSPWQIVTAGLIEPHLLALVTGCVFILWFLGSKIEEEVGSRRYLIFFAAAAIGGNLISALVDPYIFEAISSGEDAAFVYRTGLAPVSCALMAAAALFFADRRGLFGIPLKNMLYILLAIYLGLCAASFFQPAEHGNRMISSLPGCIVALFWGRLFAKAALARSKVGRKATLSLVGRAEPKEDYLSYARQFSLDEPEEDEDEFDALGVSRQEEKRMQRETEERRKVDLLLGRISGEGIDTLTRSERAFLDRYSKRKREMSKK